MAEAHARLPAEVFQDQLVSRADLLAEIRPRRVWLGINTALILALGGGLWAVWSQIAGAERELGRLAGLLAGGG